MKTLTPAEAIKKIQNELNFDQYIKPLFDPVQTHAVYNVPEYELDQIKHMLKAHGASRFRIVKSQLRGIFIICFKLQN